MSIDSRISRIYLALLTAIDQFCFHSYMVRDDPRYAQDEEALKKDRILEEYVESVKSLSIAIRDFHENGIPIVINDFDSRAYGVIKGILPYYLNLPQEHHFQENVRRGYNHLYEFGAWLTKRIPLNTLIVNYKRILLSGTPKAYLKSQEEADRLAKKFEERHPSEG